MFRKQGARSVTARFFSSMLLSVLLASAGCAWLDERQRQIIDLVPNLIFVKDANGRFLMVNAAFAEFYGKTVEEIQGADESALGLTDAEVSRYRAEDQEVLRSGVPRFVPESSAVAADGSQRTLHSIKIPFTFSRTTSVCVLCVTTDVTAIKNAEKGLTQSLREKDVLLKEVHHRVKNNLQVINSLLSLQAQEFVDPVLREALIESQNRIRSMAMVHEQLYSAGDLAGIDFGDYISRLAGQLMRVVTRPGITYEVESDHVSIGIDVAVPCGLIVNELISNALKHAFQGREKGHIIISLHPFNDEFAEFMVRDDGVGYGDYLEQLTYLALERHHPGWEINDGACGELAIDVAEATFVLDCSLRFTATDDHSTEL